MKGFCVNLRKEKEYIFYIFELIMDKILFYEKQRFSQWWLWLLLGIIGIFIFKPIYAVIAENKEISTDQWIGILILVLVIVLFLLVSLETKIKEEGIYVKFFPFNPKFRFYPWFEIDKVLVRKYSPLMDYGGWGIRFGRNGTAYNIKGNIGLQLKFKNGNALLIGTQKPEELQKVLDQIRLPNH